MKKIFGFLTMLVLVVAFTGCSNKSISMGGVSESDIKHRFQGGILEKNEKVIVAKSKLSTLTYGGVGAVLGGGAGAAIGDSREATIIGAIVGAGIGLVSGAVQETEAYHITIRNLDTNKRVTAFVSSPIEIGSVLEYVERNNNEITNVNVIETATQLKKRLERELKEEKRRSKTNNNNYKARR